MAAAGHGGWDAQAGALPVTARRLSTRARSLRFAGAVVGDHERPRDRDAPPLRRLDQLQSGLHLA